MRQGGAPLRSATVPLVLLACLLVAGSAIAGTAELDEQTTEVSTGEVTCGSAMACDTPSATARATVEPASATPEDPNPDCAADAVDDYASGEDDHACEMGGADVDPGTVRTYLGIDGLEGVNDDGMDANGQPAAEQGDSDDGVLSSRSETMMLVGALGLGASGAAAWFGLKRIVTFLLAPLASRLKRSELLDNETRRAIYEKVQEDPGVNLRGLADELDLAWGTLLHHLRKLEDNHLIVSERYGKYRRFFLNGSTYTKEEQARLAALSTPSTARVAEYILENPGANQSEIGDAIGVTPSTILFHVRRLKDVDLVEEEREGRYVKYYPNIQDDEANQMAVA